MPQLGLHKPQSSDGPPKSPYQLPHPPTVAMGRNVRSHYYDSAKAKATLLSMARPLEEQSNIVDTSPLLPSLL